MRCQVRPSLAVIVFALGISCNEARPPSPLLPDSGVTPRVASVTKEDATRIVRHFLAGLESGDRAALRDTLAAVRLADAISRPPAPPLGPERHAAFRDALTAELLRDEWRALYAGASVNRVAVGPPGQGTVVVVSLDGGTLRRAEVANENGQPLIVRIY
jgi:hypothetical protein